MKLSFLAKGDLLVTLPNQSVHRRNADTGAGGAPIRYVGRVHVPAVLRHDSALGREVVDSRASNPATREPFVCESDSPMAPRLMRFVRQEVLWPADKATADACGVAFTEIEFRDGEHVDKNPKVKTAPAPAASGTGSKSKSEASA